MRFSSRNSIHFIRKVLLEKHNSNHCHKRILLCKKFYHSLVYIYVAIDVHALTTTTTTVTSRWIPSNTYNAFRLWRPKNILLCISAILFSDNSKSCIFDAPSNAFCSIPVIWLRRKSNFTKFGRRPNKPSDLMRPSSLSLSNLLTKNSINLSKFNS